MEYIKKRNIPPTDWGTWFTTATNIRSYNYGTDYGSLTNVSQARQFLLDEQNGLCAYCQQEIKLESSSIEHVIPKEFNLELSTSYYNLIAVCKIQVKDSLTGKFHCDREKGNKLLAPIIFLSNATSNDSSINCYFTAQSDGKIGAKHNLPEETRVQIESFITILNLNHENLRQRRAKDVLDGLISAYISLDKKKKSVFWKIQYDRILKNKKQPYRQFLLIFIGNKIGIN